MHCMCPQRAWYLVGVVEPESWCVTMKIKAKSQLYPSRLSGCVIRKRAGALTTDPESRFRADTTDAKLRVVSLAASQKGGRQARGHAGETRSGQLLRRW